MVIVVLTKYGAANPHLIMQISLLISEEEGNKNILKSPVADFARDLWVIRSNRVVCKFEFPY